MTDPADQIEWAMTCEERDRFIANVTERNPHLRGAHVADLLDEMNSLDSHSGLVEGYLEQYKPSNVALFATAVRAVIYIKGSLADMSLDDVLKLVNRVPT